MDKDILKALVELTVAQTNLINTIVKFMDKSEIKKLAANPNPGYKQDVAESHEFEVTEKPAELKSDVTYGEPIKFEPAATITPIEGEEVNGKIPFNGTGDVDDEFAPYMPGDTYKLGHKVHTMLRQAKAERFDGKSLPTIMREHNLESKINYQQFACYFGGQTVPSRDDILIMLEDVTGIPAELLKKASEEDRVWRKRGAK